MDFNDLIQRAKTIPIDQMRREEGGYFECVLTRENIDLLSPILETFFGPPFKPAGDKPSAKASDYTKNFGGIMVQQTLYYAEKDGVAHCAMLWPWNNGLHVTLKMAKGLVS